MAEKFKLWYRVYREVMFNLVLYKKDYKCGTNEISKQNHSKVTNASNGNNNR